MDKIKVLIVEDMPIALMGALIVLKKFNLEVDNAENGEKALELASKIEYQIVFLDLGLPDIEGVDVAKKLRSNTANATHSNVFIIALTAHAEEDYQKECEIAGINKFLTKPLTEDDVINILHQFDQYAA